MATTKLLGTDTICGTNLSAGYVRYLKFTALKSGQVTEIKAYAGANGNVKVAIYDDDAGAPGDRITANNTPQAVTAGQWNTLSIAATDVLAGIDYQLGLANDVAGAGKYDASGGPGMHYKAITFSTFTFPDPAEWTNSGSGYLVSIAGWGIFIIAPLGLSQPIGYGTPKFRLTVKPSGHQQPIGYGALAVEYGKFIFPEGLAVPVGYGTPELEYGNWIFPGGLAVPVGYGTPTVERGNWIYPDGLVVPIGYGTPWVRIKRLLAPTRIRGMTREKAATRVEDATRVVEL
jgi:hypothetical protein